MDFYQAKEFFSTFYKGKEVKYEFDDQCMRVIEIVCTDALPGLFNHVEYRKLKVTAQGHDPIYISILPHRMEISWADVKKTVEQYTDVYIDPATIEEFKKAPPDKKINMKKDLMKFSGLSEQQLDAKLNK